MIWSQFWGCVPVTSKIKKKDYAKMQNNMEFMNTFMTFYTLLQSIFKWNNLPETCDARMLETFLTLNGQAMICKKDGAFFSLASAGGYDINMNGYPTMGYGYGMNGVNWQFRLYVPGAQASRELLKTPSGSVLSKYLEPEAVICYDNVYAYPPIAYVMNDAKRLADLVRSTDVAVKTLKSPIIIGVSESEISALRALLEDYDNNVFATLVAKGFSLDSINVWPTNGKPETIEAIWNQYLNIWSRLLSTFGINSNPNEDKKERLVVDEVNANNQYLALNMQKRLEWRQKFCEQVNELWGLNISVEINPEVKSYVRPDDTGDGMQDDSDDGTGEGDRNTGGDS